MSKAEYLNQEKISLLIRKSHNNVKDYNSRKLDEDRDALFSPFKNMFI